MTVNEAAAWDEAIEFARSHPLMFIGDHDCVRHMEEALRVLYITRPFGRSISVHMRVSPHQYLIRCDAGPIHRKFRPYLKLSHGLNISDSFNITSDDLIGSLRSGWFALQAVV